MDASINTQINILTFVMSAGVVIVGVFMGYMKVSISGAIKQARLDNKQDIESAKNELKSDLARKDLTDAKLQELERRITKTETWREAVTAANIGPVIKNGI